MSCTSVDLLEPVPPRMPTVMPASICRFIPARANFCALAEYLKETFSKSTEPSFISVTASSGEDRDGVSSSTSQIRRADSADIVSMT